MKLGKVMPCIVNDGACLKGEMFIFDLYEKVYKVSHPKVFFS
jgi:hypothetical protein